MAKSVVGIAAVPESRSSDRPEVLVVREDGAVFSYCSGHWTELTPVPGTAAAAERERGRRQPPDSPSGEDGWAPDPDGWRR